MCITTISALLLAIYCSASEAMTSVPSKCQLGDKTCLDNIVNSIKPLIFGKIPGMGVESSDPLFIQEIVADISGFKYKLYNSTWIGYSKCVFSNMTINDDITKIEYDMDCPSFILSGMYEMSGEVLSLPVKGNGDYQMIAGSHIHFVSDLVTAKDASGKTHIALENFKLKRLPSSLHFDFKNMYNGQQKLSDEFHKVFHDNWRLIDESFGNPIWYACIGKVVNNLNKYFQSVPLENFIHL